jgi:MerR family transcriptional regulator, repressor of the yfmOP operon
MPSMTTNPPTTTPDAADEQAGKPARYQIGEVAERTGVTQRTLRFYEEKGLVEPVERMEGGFRLYSDSDVERILYIKQMQDLLGFSLSEIKEMVDAEEQLRQLAATFRPDRELPVRLERLEQVVGALTLQLEVVNQKVESLTDMREELRAKLARATKRRAEIRNAIAENRATLEA